MTNEQQTTKLTTEQQTEIKVTWYRPGKSLQEFHESEAFTRGVVGGRGSGKTTSVSLDVIRHGLHNPGAKILCLRKTQVSQKDTTIDTFNSTYNQLGALYQQTSTSLFQKWGGGLTVRLPSLLAIEKYNEFMSSGSRTKQEIELWLQTEGERFCSYLEFRGLPDAAKAGNKLRGFECSLAVLVEADMLTKDDYDLVVPCLRWKNSLGEYIQDTGIIIDTNPPGPNHWIAQLEEETKADKDFKFWHIPTEENKHNLPVNYIENLKRALRKNPAMYKRMVLGEYAEAFDGTPVFYAYDQERHVYEDLPFPKGAYLVRSWDFGTTWAVIYSAYFVAGGQEYWWVLKEQYEENSDIDRQCREVIKCTATNFKYWNNRNICQGVLDYCDPAGKAKTALGSVLTTLSTYGIHPGFRTKKRGIGPTVAICNRLLESENINGDPIFRIDMKHAPLLHDAFLGGYRYPQFGESGFGKEDPVKDGKYDHLCFAAGTKITTSEGPKNIEEIQIGDLILTRKGFKKCTAAWRTSPNSEVRIYTFSNGKRLVATDDHPIWIKDRFIPLKEMKIGDKPLIWWDHEKELCDIYFDWKSPNVRETPVYNITVEDEHEYFAEGILVKNCDAWRYGIINTMRLAKMDVEAKNPVVGIMKTKIDLNPKRRDY